VNSYILQCDYFAEFWENINYGCLNLINQMSLLFTWLST
jgi:hypothetical protein